MAGLIFFWGGPACTKFEEVFTGAGAIFAELQPVGALAFEDRVGVTGLIWAEKQPAAMQAYSDVRPAGIVYRYRLPEPDCKHD
jgi:hypothetical protein